MTRLPKQTLKGRSRLSSDHRTDLRFSSTTVELRHIHVIHVAKDSQMCRSCAAIRKTHRMAKFCEEAASTLRMAHINHMALRWQLFFECGENSLRNEFSARRPAVCLPFAYKMNVRVMRGHCFRQGHSCGAASYSARAAVPAARRSIWYALCIYDFSAPRAKQPRSKAVKRNLGS